METQTLVEQAPHLTGIAPKLLLEQVRSTLGYLDQLDTTSESRRYLQVLKNFTPPNSLPLSLSQYFELCMSAHWATAGTYVPTDVDNLIRYKLWRAAEGERSENKLAIREEQEKMFALTIEAFKWDYLPVTRKVVPIFGRTIATHEGTWFSVAMGAYAWAIKIQDINKMKLLEELVVQEILFEEKALQTFWDQGDGLNFLRLCSLVAHNLGDLDRVLEQWNVNKAAPLMKEVFRAGHEKRKMFTQMLVAMGEINKLTMALENHRHFALRKMKKLRTKEAYLLPLCPFLDDWGKSLAQDKDWSDEDLAELARHLYEGWKYLPETVSYPRALRGIMEQWPMAKKKLEHHLPSKLYKEMFSSKFYQVFSLDQEKFERHWMRLPYHHKKLFH